MRNTTFFYKYFFIFLNDDDDCQGKYHIAFSIVCEIHSYDIAHSVLLVIDTWVCNRNVLQVVLALN